MKRAIGSTFEMSLRILLMLGETAGKSLTIDKIMAFDFITVYAKDFSLAESNLHGYSSYRFGEFAGRRELVQKGIKELALGGRVIVSCKEDGFEYAINDNGLDLTGGIECEYADTYRVQVAEVLHSFGNKGETDLLEMISQKTIQLLKEV